MVQSFETLIDDLTGVALNKVRLPGPSGTTPAIMRQPTRIRARAFDLPHVDLRQSVPRGVRG